MNPITIMDRFLNDITMYKLVLYYGIGLVIVASVAGFFHLIPYDPVYILLTTLFFVFFCAGINELFAKIWGAPANTESAYITAIILALIVTPAATLSDFIPLALIAILAIASKYMLGIRNRHIFNPVAIAVVLATYGFQQSASWWVGTVYLLPFVIFGGFLIARKTRKEDLLFTYIITAVVTSIGFALLRQADIVSVTEKVLLQSSLFFFGFMMVTEPLTMPGTYLWQLVYAGIVGFLFVPNVHIGSLYFTPELALCIGNIFAYIVGSKEKLMLFVKEKIQISPDTFDFIFPLQRKMAFIPGQYMEWTIPHDKVDSRGNRRYFTIASSPTEPNLRVGVKFYEPASSYKQTMIALTEQTPVIAAGRAGDFTLPSDKTKKLVFMAGGIGITPFRSMLKYLADTNEKRDVILLYSNRKEEDIVYIDVFKEAKQKIDAKIYLTLTDTVSIPENWRGLRGRVDAKMIQRTIPDHRERTFYLSGPNAMVNGFETVLQSLGVSPSQIKKDFFPGFA